MQLKVASINIERSLHLKRVEKFLKYEEPDVLCLQEVCERDIPFLEDLMGNKLHYAPMCLHPAEVELQPVGVALVAWGAMADVTTTYYSKSREEVGEIRFRNDDGYKWTDPDSVAEVMIAGTYQGFRIATTHLGVTQKGMSTPVQQAAARRLIGFAQQEAEKENGLLLCGDFNAPRGRETFALLAKAFIDGVPQSYTTSIDGSLHRAGQIPFMVDGLFHTPTYVLEGATLSTGVSDHCALSTTLRKA